MQMFMLQWELPRTNLLIHTNFSTVKSKRLFCCCEKVFTHMNTCLIGKNLLLEKEDFCSHVKMEDITIEDYKNAKEVSKDFDFGVYD